MEALSIGVDMKDTDIALRCNLVTLSLEEDFEEKTIIDHSAGEISTEEAKLLIEALKKELEDDIYKFYLGTSYRHLTIWEHGKVIDLAQPHNILGKIIVDNIHKEPALKNKKKRR